MIILEQKWAFVDFLNEKIDTGFTLDTCRTIANVDRHGSIRGVVAFSDFSTKGSLMHVASDGSSRWCTRAFIITSFDYAFVDCGWDRLTALVDKRNEDAFKFDTHIGFQVEGVLRDANGSNLDSWVLGFTKRDWWSSKWSDHYKDKAA